MSPDNGENRYFLDQVIRFSSQLHDAGISVGLSKLIDLLSCMKHIDISKPDDFYATCCATLISSHHDLALFDHVYQTFWFPEISKKAPEKDPRKGETDAPDGQEKNHSSQWNLQRQGSQADTHDTQQHDSETAYSPDEYLMEKDLGLMSPNELEQARRLIAELITVIANTKSRRRKKSHKGSELFFREMLRRNAVYGSDGMQILFRNKRIKKTRLMLLCDVSGSMEAYSRFLIHIIYAMYQELGQLEVAVFSTHMTLITECLNTDNIEHSLDKVTKTAHDWAGGTDIGQCLHEFNESLAREISSSRTIIVILSDGWDRGKATTMAQEMKRLSTLR